MNTIDPALAVQRLPRHIAIVMDGNGRWAEARHRPRSFGHKAGVDAVRAVVESCMKRGIEVLTLFAFSSENWRRPQQEVSTLMDLFMRALDREVDGLHDNGVRLRFVGGREAFPVELQERMARVESRTIANRKLVLNVAVNYGGRWDIVSAARALATEVQAGKLEPAAIDEALFHRATQLADWPDPDLFIRTGGETRVSNFLLWQIAYAELYFTDTLWPDFDAKALDAALDDYRRRERRFGRTGAQVRQVS